MHFVINKIIDGVFGERFIHGKAMFIHIVKK